MPNDAKQKIKIGLFVIGGLTLLLATLFFLGMSDIFTRKVRVKTYFNESVQGLSVGSQVKYRGVPVGSVTRISIRVPDKMIQVDLAVEYEHFVAGRRGSNRKSAGFVRFIESELERGMRCRLEYTGITGMRYIDFDYYAAPGDMLPKPPKDADDDDMLYIPSVPSPFKDILKALGTSLDRISRVRFEEISDGLERSLSELSGLLSDPALKSTIARINDASENLETSSRTMARVLGEERLNRVMNLLEADLKQINQLAEKLIENTEASKLPESSAAFRDASAAIVGTREELAGTLIKLNQTLDALTMMADTISSDPGSVVGGKKKPPVGER